MSGFAGACGATIVYPIDLGMLLLDVLFTWYITDPDLFYFSQGMYYFPRIDAKPRPPTSGPY